MGSRRDIVIRDWRAVKEPAGTVEGQKTTSIMNTGIAVQNLHPGKIYTIKQGMMLLLLIGQVRW